MKVVDVSCPFCGANVEITEPREFVTCKHCGKQIFVDDEIERVEHHFSAEDAEEMGYQFEKGRQRAKEEKELEEIGSQWLPSYRNNPYSDYGQEPQKNDVSAEATQNQSKAGCGTYLLWFFFFPIMFLYWLATTNRLSKKAKIIIAVIIIVAGAFSGGNKPKTETHSAASTANIEQAENVDKPISYDALQKLFLRINESVTPDDLTSLLEGDEFKSVVLGKRQYNGYDAYRFAYSEGVAKDLRREEGDYIEIDFDTRRNNNFMNAVYFRKGKYGHAILFHYGYYFQLGSSNPNDQSKWGYYYYSEKLRKNDHPPYMRCNDAKDALDKVLKGE